MSRRTSAVGFLVVAGCVITACAADGGVRTESADAIDPTTGTPVVTVTEDPPTPEQQNDEPPVETDNSPLPTSPDNDDDPTAETTPDDDRLLFELENFTVEVSRRETNAPPPPGGYDGFQSAAILPDGTLIASGFDARADGVQPERSSLWHSVDGINWDPVGDSLGAGAGQQRIAGLYVDADDVVHALLTHLDIDSNPDGTIEVRVAMSVDWVSDDGITWGSDRLMGNDYLSGGGMVGGVELAFGADRPNTNGEFAATIISPQVGSRDWISEKLVDASGAPFVGAVVLDMIDTDNGLIAVGATAHTDPLADPAAKLRDMLDVDKAGDVAIWRSVDDGSTWSFIETETFTGKSAPAVADVVLELDGSLYLLSRTVEADRMTLLLHRSDDGGLTWEPMRFERAIISDPDSTLINAGLFAIDGFLVVLEEQFARSQDLYMTVIDPSTGESVTHSITDELGVVQIEDIIEDDGAGIGFGRRDLGISTSDLQVVDIRRIDGAASSSTPIG